MGTIHRMSDPRQFRFINPGAEQMAGMFQRVNRQPNWIMKAAAITFLIVIGVPILILLLIAAVAATVVFAVLTGCNLLLGRSGRTPAPDSGRRNVRVINRD